MKFKVLIASLLFFTASQGISASWLERELEEKVAPLRQQLRHELSMASHYREVARVHAEHGETERAAVVMTSVFMVQRGAELWHELQYQHGLGQEEALERVGFFLREFIYAYTNNDEPTCKDRSAAAERARQQLDACP